MVVDSQCQCTICNADSSLLIYLLMHQSLFVQIFRGWNSRRHNCVKTIWRNPSSAQLNIINLLSSDGQKIKLFYFLTAKIITFSCTEWLPREHSQFWGLSLYSWSAVLEVWIQLVHYIKTITFVLLWSASVLSNWRLAVGPVLLPPTLNVLWCTFKSLYLRRVSIFIHSLVMIHPYNLI